MNSVGWRTTCLRPHPKESYLSGRDGLIQKVTAYLDGFETSRECTPASASKFRGVTGYCGTAVFDRLAKGGVSPFIQRQYMDVKG